MAAKRRKLGKKIRFEVFKRDKFTCQYCGKQAPDVVLVVDHIHPVSKGGEDVLLNYITSCEACNAGKGARTLDDNTVVAKQRAEVARLAERREQVEMMIEWHKSLAAARDFELQSFAGHWADCVTPFHLTQSGMDQARKWLRKFQLNDLLAAADVAADQYLHRDDDGKPSHASVNLAWSKIPGIARVTKLPAAERDLYYIRGILRNRLNYVDEHEAMELLTDALDVGLDTDRLKRHARSVRNWSEWRSDMFRMLDEARGASA